MATMMQLIFQYGNRKSQMEPVLGVSRPWGSSVWIHICYRSCFSYCNHATGALNVLQQYAAFLSVSFSWLILQLAKLWDTSVMIVWPCWKILVCHYENTFTVSENRGHNFLGCGPFSPHY
jgi:hypothetical protein